ncbi:FAD/FMN-containing dehydrogenase [Lentzea flaviverrucosa]|uniref:FAD/FMN-containing dehydrogenase n=2 Tax=Lentzea flaviverrucosa TaxID=200379 RepID=A0A1H9TJA7_9PSEU|nr:FAD/FMN-containing dehydrogenase [Lentzea flaviverrucosa]SER97241.1 FAD/FMN-containing dehydrogenase [Lentzea flaviverrucosa]
MRVNRRTFLQGTALGVASLGMGTATAAAAGTDWARLRRRLGERLVLPRDPGYDALRVPWNTIYAHRRPAAIARCVRPEDVQACLEFASHERIPVAARSGKHSYAAYSLPENGLVVDLAAMSAVTVAGNRARVGAGAQLLPVYEAIGAAGQALPAGTCRSVGIGGLALGGGISVLGRKYGLTSDHLVSARIVTPDGCLRTASAHEEPDLYWALRGGGGGNFGIVTEFTFRTDPAPDLTVFNLAYPVGASADVFDAWQEWMAQAPDELWSSCKIEAGPVSFPNVGGVYVGPKKNLVPLLDKMPAGTREVQEMGYLETMRYYAGNPGPGFRFTASSRMLRHHVPGERVAGLMDGQRDGAILIDSFGGALARVAPDATAFPHRDARASAQIFFGAEDRTEAEARRVLAGVRDGLGVGNTGYVNYIDPEMPDWPTAYYGRNLARLRKVARRHDPDRVLAFPQGL